MGKNVPLSEVERAQIVALHKEGHSERLISQKMKKSKTAVHNAMAKFRNTGTYTTAKKSGRPRKTTPRDDHAIRRIAVRSPMSSASKIRSSLLAKGTDISRRTVSRRLVDDFDLKAHKPAHKPRLTQAMKSKRLAFAKKHVKWTCCGNKCCFPTNLPCSSSPIESATSGDHQEKDSVKDIPFKP